MCMQVWLGYTQSLRPTQSGLTLNMDMAATAFLEVQPVIDCLLRSVNFRSPEQFANASPQIIRKAARAIAGIKARLLRMLLGVFPMGRASCRLLSQLSASVC